jgi:hypothetical protein
MFERSYGVLRPYIIAAVIVATVFITVPYLFQQYQKYQRRLWVREMIDRVEEKREREIPTAGKALQQPNDWLELARQPSAPKNAATPSERH